jgi:hypothetical protein
VLGGQRHHQGLDHRSQPGAAGLDHPVDPVAPQGSGAHRSHRHGLHGTGERVPQRLRVRGQAEGAVDGVGADERHGVQTAGAGRLDEPPRRGVVVGHLPAVHGHVDDLGAEPADVVGEQRLAAVALHDHPPVRDPEAAELVHHLGAGLARGLPSHVEPGGDGGAAGLGAAGQHGGGGARQPQLAVEAGALGRRQPRSGADPGGEHDQIGGATQRGPGGFEGRVGVVEQVGVHDRPVDHLGPPAGEHLGLLVPTAMAGDPDRVARERADVRGHEGTS